MLNASTPFEAVRQRADVLASVRHGEYLFKRPEPSYEVELDLFRKTLVGPGERGRGPAKASAQAARR